MIFQTARLTEAEAAIDNLNAKLNQVEKAKAKIASESSDMANSLDQVLNAATDRKAKLLASGRARSTACPSMPKGDSLFKIKSAYEETMLQLEEVREQDSLQ